MEGRPNGNGYPRWRDIERLDRRIDTQDEGVKWIAQKGAEHNEQIRGLQEGQHDLTDALREERKEREQGDADNRAFNNKVLWLLVTTAFMLAAAAVAFAFGVLDKLPH